MQAMAAVEQWSRPRSSTLGLISALDKFLFSEHELNSWHGGNSTFASSACQHCCGRFQFAIHTPHHALVLQLSIFVTLLDLTLAVC
jgi:hypothetical protein